MDTQQICEQALTEEELKELFKNVRRQDYEEIFESALTLDENGTLTVIYCQPLLDFLSKVLDYVANNLGLKKLVIQDTAGSFRSIPPSCFRIPIEFVFGFGPMGIMDFSCFLHKKMCLVDYGGWFVNREEAENLQVTELTLKFHQDRNGIMNIINCFPFLEKVHLVSLSREHEEKKDMTALINSIASYCSRFEPKSCTVSHSTGKYETLYW